MTYSKVQCERDHTGEVPEPVLARLPKSQAHPVRHRCAACAYEAGVQSAAEEIARLREELRRLLAAIGDEALSDATSARSTGIEERLTVRTCR